MIELLKRRVVSFSGPKKATLIVVVILTGVALLSRAYSISRGHFAGVSSASHDQLIGVIDPSREREDYITSETFSTVSTKLREPSSSKATRPPVASGLLKSRDGNDPLKIARDGHVTRKFPQAIIIGVKKGGTRALTDMLKSHPGVKSAIGEVHFFDREENYKKGLEWYMSKMPLTTQNQIAIEKSPSYFVTPDVPDRMHALSPDLKLLLIVRNPIDRAVSDFCQLHTPDRQKKNVSFEKLVLNNKQVDNTLPMISVSTYDVHMSQWLQHFSLKQIHVVDGDALIRNPAEQIIKVEQFLGLSSFFREEMFYFNTTKGFYCWKKSRHSKEIPYCLGSSKGRPHPTIAPDVLQCLRDYFRPHNKNFYDMVGKDFNWDKS